MNALDDFTTPWLCCGELQYVPACAKCHALRDRHGWYRQLNSRLPLEMIPALRELANARRVSLNRLVVELLHQALTERHAYPAHPSQEKNPCSTA